MKLKDIYKKLIKERDEYEKFALESKNLNYKGDNKDILDKAYDYTFNTTNFTIFRKTIMRALEKKGLVADAYKFLPKNKELNYGEIRYKALQLSLGDEAVNSIKYDYTKATDEYVKKVIGNDEKALKLYEDKYADCLGLPVSIEIPTNEKVFDGLTTYFNEEELDELAKQYEERALTKTHYLNSYVYKEEEVDELIKLNPESKDNLKYIKENVLTINDAESTDVLSTLAEKYGALSDKLAQQQASIELKKSVNKDVINVNNESRLEINEDLSLDRIKDIKNEALEKGIKLNKDTKKTIINCLKAIDKLTDVETGGPLLNDTYHEEEGTKVYAFKNLATLRIKIDKAIDEKDIDSLNNLALLHKEESKKMNDIIKMASSLDADLVSGNISVARNNTFSNKITNDIKGASLVNSLWHMLAYTKKIGVSIEEFVDNPIKHILQYQSQAYNDAALKKYSTVGDFKFIDSMFTKKQNAKDAQEIFSKYKPIRPFDMFMFADKDCFLNNCYPLKEVEDIFCGQTANECYQLYSMYFISNAKETIKNIILAPTYIDKETGKVAKDYTKLSAFYFNEKNLITQEQYERFDSAKVLEDGTYSIKDVGRSIKDLLDNRNQLPERIKNDCIAAIHEVGVKVLEQKDCTDSLYFRNICTAAKKNPIDVYKGLANSNDITEYCINKANEVNANNELTKEQKVAIQLNAMKALKDKYDRRSIFGKIFRPVAHREKDAYKEIKNQLIAMKIKEDDLDKILSGDSRVSDFVVKESKTNSKSRHIEVNEEELTNNIMESSLEKDKSKEIEKDLEISIK